MAYQQGKLCIRCIRNSFRANVYLYMKDPKEENLKMPPNSIIKSNLQVMKKGIKKYSKLQLNCVRNKFVGQQVVGFSIPLLKIMLFQGN